MVITRNRPRTRSVFEAGLPRSTTRTPRPRGSARQSGTRADGHPSRSVRTDPSC